MGAQAEWELELSHLAPEQHGKTSAQSPKEKERERGGGEGWHNDVSTQARGRPGVLRLLPTIIPDITANLCGSADRCRTLALRRSLCTVGILLRFRKVADKRIE